MNSSRMTISWILVLIAESALVAYGIGAIIFPDSLFSPSFEKLSGQSWDSLVSASPKVAAYISLSNRLIGGFNIAFGVLAIFVAMKGLRKGTPWCWYALLIGNSLAYGAPISFDLSTGQIALPEISEIVLIGVIYFSLSLSARDVLQTKSA